MGVLFCFVARVGEKEVNKELAVSGKSTILHNELCLSSVALGKKHSVLPGLT